MKKKTLGTILKVVLTPLTYTWLFIAFVLVIFGDTSMRFGDWMSDIVNELKW